MGQVLLIMLLLALWSHEVCHILFCFTFEFLFISLSSIAFALKTKTFSVDKNYSDFLQPKSGNFIWNTEKKSLYKSLLNEEPVLSEGKTILNKMTQDKLSHKSIDTAVDSI